MQRDRAQWRGGAVGPDRVDQVGLDRDQRGARRGAGLGQSFGAFDGVQPRVVAKAVGAREIGLQPPVRRLLDQMLDGEQRGIDLLAHLQRVAAVDEQHRALHQHDRGAGRPGKAGEPGEALLGRRHVFVLMAVGARNDEARRVRAAPVRCATPRRAPRLPRARCDLRTTGSGPRTWRQSIEGDAARQSSIVWHGTSPRRDWHGVCMA